MYCDIYYCVFNAAHDKTDTNEYECNYDCGVLKAYEPNSTKCPYFCSRSMPTRDNEGYCNYQYQERMSRRYLC